MREGYDLMGAHLKFTGKLAAVWRRSIRSVLNWNLNSGRFHLFRVRSCWFSTRESNSRYIPDLVVFDGIVVELKSVKALLSEHEAQLINYMRNSRKPVGYLINFGPLGEVEWKRFVLTDSIKLLSGAMHRE